MKKIIGLSVTALSILGFSSLLNVNALAEPAVASNFKNADTRAKLRFSYNLETLEASNIEIKFGGPVLKTNYNADAEHGVIVVPGAEYTNLVKEDSLLAIDEFNKLNNNKYVLKFDEGKIADLNIEGFGEARQYAWVLKTSMPYDYTYAAVMYEKMGDVVTLANPLKHSIGSLINSYMFDVRVDNKIKEVISKYSDTREEKVQVELSEDLLYPNIQKGNYPKDGKFKVFTHGWNSFYEGSEGLVEAKYNSESKSYTVTTSPKNDNILFLLMPENSTEGNYETALCQSKNLVIKNNKVLDGNKIVTYNNVTEKFQGRYNNQNGVNIDGKPLYAEVWKYGCTPHLVKVNPQGNVLTTTADMTCVKFFYMIEDKPDFGEKNSNVLLESEPMALASDEKGFLRTLEIKYDKICENIGWGTIDKNQYKLWARCWNSANDKTDRWYEVSYNNLEISAEYDRVIFVVKKKEFDSGWDNKEVQSKDYSINGGYIWY